jgi:hypothetical protein
MQVWFRSLLVAMLATWVASCALNDRGLGGSDAGTGRVELGGNSGMTSGAGGQLMGAAGTSPPLTGAAGDATMSGVAGAAAGAAGDSSPDAAMAGDSATGAAGDSSSGGAGASPTGAAGDSSIAGAGAAGDSAAGASGATGAAGSSAGGAGGAGPDPGCSDGSREGYVDLQEYPTIAACAGGWDEPGLDSDASMAPECDRHGGNDGDHPDGHGCSVEDLCADGWSVCASAHVVSNIAGSCDDALAPSGDKPVFFLTRQRAVALVCTPANSTGTNNFYGCGNIGSAADKSCTPFTHMMRDTDCQNQPPWSCGDTNGDDNQDEYSVVTKPGPTKGGVLCCKN